MSVKSVMEEFEQTALSEASLQEDWVNQLKVGKSKREARVIDIMTKAVGDDVVTEDEYQTIKDEIPLSQLRPRLGGLFVDWNGRWSQWAVGYYNSERTHLSEDKKNILIDLVFAYHSETLGEETFTLFADILEHPEFFDRDDRIQLYNLIGKMAENGTSFENFFVHLVEAKIRYPEDWDQLNELFSLTGLATEKEGYLLFGFYTKLKESTQTNQTSLDQTKQVFRACLLDLIGRDPLQIHQAMEVYQTEFFQSSPEARLALLNELGSLINPDIHQRIDPEVAEVVVSFLFDQGIHSKDKSLQNTSLDYLSTYAVYYPYIDQDIIPVMIASIQNPKHFSYDSRESMIERLGEMGDRAKAASPVLVSRIVNNKEPEPKIVSAMLEALNKIDPQKYLLIHGKARADKIKNKIEIQEQDLEKEIRENAGVLAALRDSALDSALGNSALSSDIRGGIGGLIGARGTQIGSGGLGSKGSGLGGGGSADGLGGLGTKGRGSGASGYGSGSGHLGEKGEGGIGKIGGDPIILGALDKSLIDAVIKRNMNQIRYCYQRELNKNPALSGKIVVKFVIANDGTVSSADTKTTTMHNPAVESCMNDRFMRFQFPEPKGGGIVVVSYPFLLSPA